MSTSDSDHARFDQANRLVLEMKDKLGYSEKEIAGRATKLRAELRPREPFNRAISPSTICRIANKANAGKRQISKLLAEVLERLAEILSVERSLARLQRMTMPVDVISHCLQQGTETSEDLRQQCRYALIRGLQNLFLHGVTDPELPPKSPGMAAWVGGQKMLVILAADMNVMIHELEEALRYLRASQKHRGNNGGGNGPEPAW